MLRWEQGRATVERLVADGRIDVVPANRGHANALIAQARGFLASAKLVSPTDPMAAFVLAYDAARRALTAILENQGLRPTSRGGHIAVIETVAAQLDPPLGPAIRRLNRLRSRRNRLEYPTVGEPPVTAAEVEDALAAVEAGIDMADRVLDTMPPWT